MEIEEILLKFEGTSPVLSSNTITYGNINRTYQLHTANGDYILQRVNTSIFKNPVALMNNIIGICDHIRKKYESAGESAENRVISCHKTLSGDSFFTDPEGGCWRVYDCINGISHQSAEKKGLFGNAAEAFGIFQGQLADYPVEKLVETIPNFHNTVSRFADFEKAVNCPARPERKEEAKAEIEALLSREKLAHVAVDAIAAGELPLRVTHNDTKLNNILMDPVTDKGLCVIDLDTVMPGSVLYDFGDAIRFGANTAAEDEPDLSKVSLNPDAFEEFTRGFLKGTGGALTEKELALLPEGAMLMTYECALRFLGDYLMGDVYFKINGEKHNLVRARAQIALLEDMEKKLSMMHAIVDSCR